MDVQSHGNDDNRLKQFRLFSSQIHNFNQNLKTLHIKTWVFWFSFIVISVYQYKAVLLL